MEDSIVTSDSGVDNTVDNTTNDTQVQAEADATDVWSEDYDVDAMDNNGSDEVADKADHATEDEVIPVELTEVDYKAQNDNADAKLDKPILIKLKGKVIEVSNVSEMRNLMELGLGATAKYRDMADDRKTIQFMSDNNIDMDALTSLVNSRGQDVVTTDNSQYTIHIDTIAKEIESSNYVDTFRDVASMMPDDVIDIIKTNPNALAGFRNDVSSGRLTATAMHEIDKLTAIKGMSFQDAYVQVTTNTATKNKVADESRNTLTSQPKNTQVSSAPKSVWDMTDSEYDKYFSKL